MHAEGELRNNLDDSERVRELQDKVAELKAEVCEYFLLHLCCISESIDLKERKKNCSKR